MSSCGGGDRRVLGAEELGTLLGGRGSLGWESSDHMVYMKDDYHWPGDGVEATQEPQDDAVEGSR